MDADLDKLLAREARRRSPVAELADLWQARVPFFDEVQFVSLHAGVLRVYCPAGVRTYELGRLLAEGLEAESIALYRGTISRIRLTSRQAAQ